MKRPQVSSPLSLATSLAALTLSLLSVRANAQHIIQIPADIPVTLEDGATAILWVSEDSTIRVTAHVPDPFELRLSMSATASAQVTAAVPVQTIIDGSKSFTALDHDVWCIGTQQNCSPPYNGNGYYGFRVTLADGVHYGWIGTYFINLGFGRAVTKINTAAYDIRPNYPIQAGIFEVRLGECGSADFDCNGDIGTDADIEAFFACLAGLCPGPPCSSSADFDGDGDSGTDADIEAFFRILAGNPCVPT
jgi:hypothetical protein